MKAGSEFLGLVIGSGVLGFGIDHFAGTTPWAMLGLILTGLVYSTVRAQKEMNKKD